MNFSAVIEAYVNDLEYQPLSSLKAHKGKVSKYFKKLGDIDIHLVLDEKNLSEFIYNSNASRSNTYHALLNFYQFYHKRILKQNIIPAFPVQDPNLKVKGGREIRTNHVLLDQEQIKQLFNDDFYSHLNDEKAVLTAKASIALCLSAGYDSGDFSPSNHVEAMTLNDCKINNGYVEVRNFATQSTVPTITIRGEFAEYIKQYYEVRSKFDADTKNFICRIWDSRNLNYSREIDSVKPYEPHHLLNYMLKYISYNLGLEAVLYATHLRTNMVYHSLLNSSGASLHQIIEVFGFPPYVKYAFDKYCEKTNNTIYFGFNDFFDETSLDEIGQNDSSFNEEDIESMLNAYILEKRPRDTKKVKELKTLYSNACQICGTSVTLLQSFSYSEVHHIQPHGKQHNGIDDFPNMIVLCPNHHTLFDLGLISLNPMNAKRIIHIDPNNPIHDSELKIWKHELSSIAVRYHYENIFLPLKQRLSL